MAKQKITREQLDAAGGIMQVDLTLPDAKIQMTKPSGQPAMVPRLLTRVAEGKGFKFGYTDEQAKKNEDKGAAANKAEIEYRKSLIR